MRLLVRAWVLAASAACLVAAFSSAPRQRALAPCYEPLTTAARGPAGAPAKRRLVSRGFGRNPLPPGGGGPQLPGLPTIALIALLFAFPGFFFNLINGFILAFVVVPAILSWAYSFWYDRNVVNAPCPNCGAPLSTLRG